MTTRLRSDDPAFPADLLPSSRARRGLADELRVLGSWPQRPGIAVVGTRDPTPEAVDLTRALVDALVDAGWSVWSGGARGIDGVAHEAALARGGTTVVVTPSGFARPYPPEHADMFERAARSGGAIVTPFAEDTEPMPPHFHKRNGVLAALTRAMVVVQAGVKSGARSAAGKARMLERPLFVVPHAPWDVKGAGCALELERGARAITRPAALIEAVAGLLPDPQMSLPLGARGHDGDVPRAERAHDLAREHGRARVHDRARVAEVARDLDPAAARVLAAIGETPIHTDDLCDRTALSVAAVTAALLTLTLQAVVVEAPAGFYRRIVR